MTRHLAFLGDASTKAAEAFECVYEQSPDKAWALREYIFEHQDQLRSSGANATALLKTWVTQLGGVDMAKFNASLDSGKYTSLIQQERTTGNSLKIPGTPSIFVGSQLVQGAGSGVPTTQEIGAVIDQALALKQQGR